MIVFFGEGRLGNQIFQYAFMKTVEEKKQIMIVYNFDEFLMLFGSIPYVRNLTNKYHKFVIKKIGLPFFDLLARLRIIASYRVNTYKQNEYFVENTSFVKRKGLLSINYFYPFFAQSEIFFSKKSVRALNVKQNYQEVALSFLADSPLTRNNVFVHIRRGDYIHFTIYGKKGTTLPLSYYKERIKWFEKNIENPFFIFLTDDPEFVEYCFEETRYKIISNNSMFVDFSIMTKCEYGILSNSSFSWWGGYLMTVRKKVFAPKYWLGWKSKSEFPRGIYPSFAEIVDIDRLKLNSI